MWTVNLWGPQYAMALTWSPQCADGQWICGTFFSMWGPLWICRAFGMTWLLAVVRGSCDLDGRWICGSLVSRYADCRVLSQFAGPSVWHNYQSSSALSRVLSVLPWAPSLTCLLIKLFLFLFWIWGPTQKIVDQIRWVFSFFFSRDTWGPQKVRTPRPSMRKSWIRHWLPSAHKEDWTHPSSSFKRWQWTDGHFGETCFGHFLLFIFESAKIKDADVIELYET